MTANTQRSFIIVLLIAVIGILLFPEVVRKAVLEVTTEQTGRTHDSESELRPNPQNIRIEPKVARA